MYRRFILVRIFNFSSALTWSSDLSNDCNEWTAACNTLPRVTTVLFKFLYLQVKKQHFIIYTANGAIYFKKKLFIFPLKRGAINSSRRPVSMNEKNGQQHHSFTNIKQTNKVWLGRKGFYSKWTLIYVHCSK